MLSGDKNLARDFTGDVATSRFVMVFVLCNLDYVGEVFADLI